MKDDVSCKVWNFLLGDSGFLFICGDSWASPHHMEIPNPEGLIRINPCFSVLLVCDHDKQVELSYSKQNTLTRKTLLIA